MVRLLFRTISCSMAVLSQRVLTARQCPAVTFTEGRDRKTEAAGVLTLGNAGRGGAE